MARTVRSAELDSRAARLRLKARGKPYYVISGKPGLHLGYRRIVDQNGRWIVRRYVGEQSYTVTGFAQADDYAEADGRDVLTYYDAMKYVTGEDAPAKRGKVYTVQQAVTDYLVWLKQQKKTATDTDGKLKVYVLPKLGDKMVNDLTDEDLQGWLTWALAYKRKRGKKTTEATESPKELLRRRKSTINRVINALKATLNHAAKFKPGIRRGPWVNLHKFGGVDAARLKRLTTDEARRLVNASPPDFRQLVTAALNTGCRYGELCALVVADYDANSETLLIAESKGGKPRRVHLTPEGAALFDDLTLGKEAHNHILTKTDGTAWSTSEQSRRMHAACEAAKINPPVNFHALRHTFASILAEKGTPMMIIADALGHTDTRMVEKHYAHLQPSIVAKSIRKNLPTFGAPTKKRAQRLRP
jgi:integrase